MPPIYKRMSAIFWRFDIIACLACICFFLIWPNFDLFISQHFYDESSSRFIWKNHIAMQFIYQLTSVIAGVLVIGSATLVVASYISRKAFLQKHKKAFIFILCACLLGPGIVVNLILKDNWDRPRPRQTLELGGSKAYEPPFSPRFECNECHSFVSGHASVGFVFFSLMLLFRNKKWLLLPVALGGGIGMVRIVQGGHFFSDVLFSGWVVWFSCLFLHYFFYTYKWPDNLMGRFRK